MRAPRLLVLLVFLLMLATLALSPTRSAPAGPPQEGTSASKKSTAEASTCPVTRPNGRGYGGQRGDGWHGNEALSTSLPEAGRVELKPGGPGCVEPDGYLGMKWPWWRKVRGTLMVEGRRLDGPAGPLRANIPGGYGDTGFQSTGLLFAGPGCWEVTGRVGEARLSFVTLVVKTGEGPATRCSAIFGGYRPHPQGVRNQD